MTWRITRAVVALVCIVCQHAAPPSAQPRGDFPHIVGFEQCATKFANGDDIRITEVRGTSPDMRGGIYRGPWNSAPRIDVTKGTGTFTLLLPMSVDGSPHVSFYDGESFGGNDIGSGDTTLKKWWHS